MHSEHEEPFKKLPAGHVEAVHALAVAEKERPGWSPEACPLAVSSTTMGRPHVPDHVIEVLTRPDAEFMIVPDGEEPDSM